jgi:hypothetical protein
VSARIAGGLYAVAMVALIVGVVAVLERPVLGTADSEYWHCLGVRSFLLQISRASMINLLFNSVKRLPN